MELFRDFVSVYLTWSIYYFVWLNTSYFILLVLAAFSIRKQMRSRIFGSQRFSLFLPGISLIAPAYNEEATIAESIKSFLMLEYPKFEVIVINDGSTDNTLQKLVEAFLLEDETLFFDSTLSKTRVRATYRSKIHPSLIVIDKDNGGKADALNTGIGFAQHEIFCSVDSDSLLEKDALSRIVTPFVQEPHLTIASGGTVRVANGSLVRHGRVVEARLPHKFLPLMQIVEYTRAFLCGRIGWNTINATLVISGAFGLFSTRAIRAIGGYTEGSIGEDMELVVRIHKHYLDAKLPYQVVFVPDPVCWTEAPETLAVLRRQRNRWQRGLADTLIKYRFMLFNPSYKAVGLLAFPYYFFAEMFGPLIELVAWICLLSGWIMGNLNSEIVILFFLASIFLGVLMNIAAFLLGEIYFSRYPKIHQFFVLILVSTVEALGYRQINLFWRLQGLLDFCRGKKGWGTMSRTGFRK